MGLDPIENKKPRICGAFLLCIMMLQL